MYLYFKWLGYLAADHHLHHSRRHGRALVGLSPQAMHQAPQIEIWYPINQWNFYQIFNVKSSWTNVKSPYWWLSGDGSDLQQKIVKKIPQL